MTPSNGTPKILVTGGCGYLGAVIVPHLLDAGYDLTVVDSMRHGVASLIALSGRAGFRFVRGDVRDAALMQPLYAKADIVIPLAAIVGAPACDQSPVDARTINLDAIRSMLAVLSPAQRIVFPTTNSGYGRTTGSEVCTEETPLRPVSLYGTTKAEAEDAILQRGNAVTFRLATVFGVSPRLRLDLLVNTFVYEAYTRGYITIYEKDAKRNYVHVNDVARAFLYAIEHFDAMKNGTFNCGLDDANLSKAELAELVQRYFPRFVVHYNEIHKDPDQRDYIVSNEKLRRAGFAAVETISDGIPPLIQAFSMLPASPYLNTAS
jgi:nucleoside-diphosphate-sugar epimerase